MLMAVRFSFAGRRRRRPCQLPHGAVRDSRQAETAGQHEPDEGPREDRGAAAAAGGKEGWVRREAAVSLYVSEVEFIKGSCLVHSCQRRIGVGFCFGVLS